MFIYFILFAVIGLGIGKYVADKPTALGFIVIIAVIWGMNHRPFGGIATFGEVMLGYLAFTAFTWRQSKSLK